MALLRNLILQVTPDMSSRQSGYPRAEDSRFFFRVVTRLSMTTLLVLSGCSTDISSPAYELDSEGSRVGVNRDLLNGVSPGTLPYDPIPPIPDGAVPPPGLIVPLGSVASASETLTRGECVLHFRRGPFGYTPVEFRLDMSRLAGGVDETATVIMHVMRGEIIGRRAICVIPRSEDDLAEVGNQLRARLKQPGVIDQPPAAPDTSSAEPTASADPDPVQHMPQDP